LPPVILSAPQISVENTLFGFALSGAVGSGFVLQASTNLVNWSSISTSTIPVSGSINLTTPIAGYEHRFYRAVIP
jgi:hypothetical protein